MEAIHISHIPHCYGDQVVMVYLKKSFFSSHIETGNPPNLDESTLVEPQKMYQFSNKVVS